MVTDQYRRAHRRLLPEGTGGVREDDDPTPDGRRDPHTVDHHRRSMSISNSRIVSVTDTHVTFRYRDRKRGNVMRTMTLDGVEFLRRFLLHLLPKGFVRIRHFGLLANRGRREKLALRRFVWVPKSAEVPGFEPQGLVS